VLRTVFNSENPDFAWLDLVEPSREELQLVAGEYGLPQAAVQDCLDPEHLPKFERFDGATFVILRAFDEQCPGDAETVQGLSRKVALFWRGDVLLSIHRKDQPYFGAVMKSWQERPPGCEDGTSLVSHLLADITSAVVMSYEPPLAESESRLDRFESSVLRPRQAAPMIQDMYLIKRRVTLTKRLLWHTLSIIQRLPQGDGRHGSLFQNLREDAESMHFYADELLDDVNNLLNMQLSLAAHRTNEVVQLLTIFSAFFLPLTFIVGVYGMNFHHMPELDHPLGYPGVWLTMLGVSLSIAVWFRRRGWL
jgi:magnesium transporter